MFSTVKFIQLFIFARTERELQNVHLLLSLTQTFGIWNDGQLNHKNHEYVHIDITKKLK